MRKITPEELKKILDNHKLWLESRFQEGKRANLRKADLRSAKLSGADLSVADLSGADLSVADLRSAKLSGAKLSGADLREANLSPANLSGANLSGADLRRTNLSNANLWKADLSLAKLSGADLRSANLRRANLEGVINADETINSQWALIDEKDRHLFNIVEEKIKNNREDAQRIRELEEQITKLKQNEKTLEQKQEEINKLKNEQSGISEEEKEKYEQKIKQKERELEKANNEMQNYEELKKELDELKQKQAKREQLETAISSFEEIKKSNGGLLKKYNTHSNIFMWSAVVLFCLVLGYTGFKSYVFLNQESTQITQTISADKQQNKNESKVNQSNNTNNKTLINLPLQASALTYFWTFIPSLIFSFIAVGLLRHDWKIRQLSQMLINHNNKIDVAVGVLRGSLELSYIDNDPNILNDTFKEVRKALLNTGEQTSSASDEKDNGLTNELLKLIRKFNSNS